MRMYFKNFKSTKFTDLPFGFFIYSPTGLPLCEQLKILKP